MFRTKAFSEPMLAHCKLNLKNKLSWIFNRNTNIFIEENTFENVAFKMGSFVSVGGSVKRYTEIHQITTRYSYESLYHLYNSYVGLRWKMDERFFND